jgi:hypothetical protein
VAINAVGMAALVLLAALPVLRPASSAAPGVAALSQPAPEAAGVGDESWAAESFAAVAEDDASAGLAQMPQASSLGIVPDEGHARMSISAAAADAGDARQIARRAELSVEVADAEAASQEAALLTNAVSGEYVESSLISGAPGSRRADVSLRVMPARVDAVLASLRELGSVEREETQSDDVTGAAADLEARLRSAEQAEAEMADLLRRRSDDPLGDVVAAQRELGPMRESAERLRSARAVLAARVVLAEVRVTLVERSAPREGMGWLPRVGSAFWAGLGDAGALCAGAARLAAALLPVWAVAVPVGAWWALRRRSGLVVQV